MLYENNIEFIKNPAGKLRRYFSIRNFFDIIKTGYGIILAIIQLFNIYPDVIFAKGGFGSFPILVAAKLLRIPVVIHESDSVPGRTNLFAGKFAKRIAISYPDSVKFFDESKVALTGSPVRRQMLNLQKSGAYEFLKLEENVPVILILSGSQGSEKINNVILETLSDLVDKYQIIHQTGNKNIKGVTQASQIALSDNKNKERYRPFPYLDTLALRMSAGIADLIITRGGSTLFEIAAWGVPSIVIPIENTNGDHQRKNAFTYAQAGAAVVIEEKNLSPHVLFADINRLMDSPKDRELMSAAAKRFAMPDAARKIAREIIKIGLGHEK